MKIAGKILLLFLSVCLTVIVVEIILRFFWNPSYLNPKYQRDDLSWLERGVTLNKFGYRDRDFSIQKKQGVYRIYSLGDSYTYGWYIDDPNRSFPKVLEQKLQEEYGLENVEVINAARPGFNFAAEVERFENEGILFNPDLVIIGLNTLDLASKEFPPRYTKNEFLKGLRLYQITLGNLERARVAKETDNEIKNIYTDNSKQLQKAEELLKKIKELIKSRDGEVIVVIFPQYNPSNPNEIYKYSEYHQQIKKLANKYDIQTIDLADIFNTYQDKRDLVLNPIDPHPSAIADQLAGEYIYKSINFKNKIGNPRKSIVSIETVNIATKFTDLKGIISLDPGWVFFNRKFDLNTQRLFLTDSSSRQVPYLEDILKTAKSFTHDGWVGAKVEYNIKAGSTFSLPLRLYGFTAVGVSKVSGFWREKGALNSQDIALPDLDITKNDSEINITIKSSREFELYKIVVDVSVNQFDIENEEVVTLFSTKIYKSASFLTDGEIGSLPKFYWGDKSINFAWIDNKMEAVEIEKNGRKIEIKNKLKDGSTIEIPVAEENSFDNTGVPLIEHI